MRVAVERDPLPRLHEEDGRAERPVHLSRDGLEVLGEARQATPIRGRNETGHGQPQSEHRRDHAAPVHLLT